LTSRSNRDASEASPSNPSSTPAAARILIRD
jgi:hypothetical protein